MKTNPEKTRLPGRFAFYAGILLLVLLRVASAGNLNISQTPLNQTVSVPPIMMLDLSRDQQLFYKAYNDYSDVNHDGAPDTTYEKNIAYYGYFNSNACYSYESGIFVPTSTTDADHYCNGNGGDWSGNFLNWVSMSRLDVVRKILYGGYRSTDSGGKNGKTILERAPLPNDAHSWAKYYDGSDLSKLTPYSDPITLCNTTYASSGYSQNDPALDAAPLIRVAKGNYELWAANERYQCRWGGEIAGYNPNDRNGAGSGYHQGHNGNHPLESGINAAEGSPLKAAVDGKDYIARVEVCVQGGAGLENDCQLYPDGDYKPVGLLQQYSGTDKGIRFGLMTGSFGKNKSGGVLRKNADFIGNEIEQSDGTFTAASSSGSIIGVLDALRIYGYSYSDGTYNNGDSCSWGLNSFSNGDCSNWGNPLSEIYLESLRYLAGKSVNNNFLPGSADSTRITGLARASWQDPLDKQNYCAKLDVMVLNASVNSYDSDQLSDAGDANINDLPGLMQTISDSEGISGKSFFVGESGSQTDQLCTKKTVDTLGDVLGVCPEAPRLEGSYDIAGLAYGAHIHSIRSDLPKKVQTVKTYGVALAPAVPEISIPVPGKPGQEVTILPACQNSSIGGDCAIVDFKIVSQDLKMGTGKFYVNWEDSEQGGDYDQDMWGTIEYSIAGQQITITTDVFGQSTTDKMGFGYVLDGTTKDGFHVQSGIYDYSYTDSSGVVSCEDCTLDDGAVSVTYTLGGTNAGILQQPLYYAAKWGGFNDGNDNNKPDLTSEWDGNGDGIPDNYFYSTSPQDLAKSLAQVFANVQREASSGTSLAINSGSVSANTQLFQAQYSSTDWSGTLLALPISSGNQNSTCTNEGLGDLCSPKWSAACDLNGGDCAATGQTGLAGIDPNSRILITYRHEKNGNGNGNGENKVGGVPFTWGAIGKDQRKALNKNKNILNYLRGDQKEEQQNGGQYRNRSSRLGDIVHSTPLYVPNPDFRYPNTFHDALYSTDGETGYSTFRTDHKTRTHVVYAGANDGFLHGFEAGALKNDGSFDQNKNTGKELMGFMPYKVSLNAGALASPSYNDKHQFFVDAPPTEGDVFFKQGWHSVLVGGLGAGGQEVYALDVTDPSDFKESNAGKLALWDFTDADDEDLGDTFGKPAIVRLHDGEWAAIVGNGYNNTADDGNKSTTGDAVLYVLNISDGTIIRKLDTGVGVQQDPSGQGHPNGIAEVTPIDVDGDLTTDYVAAGDLYGNVWVFDLTSQSSSGWKVANDKPLFQARGPDGKVQPITTKILVNFHPKGQKYGVMLYFGTGKYFEVTDAGAHPDDVQSFYGVWDPYMTKNFPALDDFSSVESPVPLASTPLSRTSLVQQSILHEGNLTRNDDGSLSINSDTTTAQSGGTALRVTSNNPVDYTKKMGWYLDLISPNLKRRGEMVEANPSLIGNSIVFPTLIPSSEACGVSGTGWVMALNPATGGQLPSSPFDVDGDTKFSRSDLITLSDGSTVAAGGTFIGGGGPSSQIFLGQAKTIYTQMAGNGGGGNALNSVNKQLFDPGLRFLGRKSWHEIR